MLRLVTGMLILIFLSCSACTLDANLVKVIADSSQSPGGNTTPPPTPPPDLWGQQGLQKVSFLNRKNRAPSHLSRLPNGEILVWEDSEQIFYKVKTDGTLDSSFGANGLLTITTPLPETADMAALNNAVYLAHGGNAVTGLSVSKVKYDGTMDSTFGTNGVSTISATGLYYVKQLSIGSDGKLTVLGFKQGAKYEVFIARLDTAGALDNTYGTNGILMLADAAPLFAHSFELNPDNSLWVVTSNSWSNNNIKVRVQKITPNGAVDTAAGFATGTGGVQTISLPGVYRGEAKLLRLMSDGKILVFGSSRTCNGCSDTGFSVRLNSDGSLDTSYGGGDGIESSNWGNNVFIEDAYEVAGNKWRILTKNGSAQITSTGVLDATYGTNGLAPYSMFPTFKFASLERTGSDLYVLGTTPLGSPSVDNTVVAKMNLALTPDTAYGNLGSFSIAFGNASSTMMGSVALDNGKTMVLASSWDTTPSVSYLTRLNKDGSVDTSFGDQGFILNPFSSAGYMELLCLDAAGNILLMGSGNTNDEITVARLLPDGTTDASFGTNGVSSHIFPGIGSWFMAFNATADGKIHVVTSNGDSISVARLLNDGSIDTSYGGGDGYQDNIALGGLAWPFVMFAEVKADGKIALAGYSNNDNVFAAQIDSTGALDTTFSGDGVLEIDLGSDYEETPQGLAIDSSGRLFILVYTLFAPNYDDDLAIVSVNADGSMNTNFDGDGILLANANYTVDTNAWMHPGLRVDRDGNLFALVESANDDYSTAIISWKPDGTLNSDFANNGLALFDAPATYRNFADFHIDAAGNLKVFYKNLLSSGIVRIHRELGIMQ